MELYEIYETLKLVWDEKDKAKAKRILDDLMSDMFDELVKEHVCPHCGAELIEKESLYYECGHAQIDDFWYECENCGKRYDLD